MKKGKKGRTDTQMRSLRMASLRAARGIATLQNIAKIATWQTLLNCKALSHGPANDD